MKKISIILICFVLLAMYLVPTSLASDAVLLITTAAPKDTTTMSNNVSSQVKIPTLDEIANTFNNNSDIKEFAELSSVWIASVEENKICVTISYDDVVEKVYYVLEGNILSVDFSEVDVFTGMVCSIYLIDSIGVLYGYEEGDLARTIGSEEVVKYTLENEGIFLDADENLNVSSIKVDISKKIPLIDFSNVYFTVEDLEDFAETLSGEGSTQYSKGNVWFYKVELDNGDVYLLIAENKALTTCSYKSMLSLVERICNSSSVSNYVAKNYSGFEVGNKELKGIKIEVNPEKNDIEKEAFSDDENYGYVRITINKTELTSVPNVPIGCIISTIIIACGIVTFVIIIIVRKKNKKVENTDKE